MIDYDSYTVALGGGDPESETPVSREESRVVPNSSDRGTDHALTKLCASISLEEEIITNRLDEH